MITVLVTLVFGIAALLAFYIHRLAELTHPENESLRESLKDSCAGAVLKEIEGRAHAAYFQIFTERERREFCFDFMRSVMPMLFEEAQKVALATRSPMAILHFGLFCLSYSLVWIKFRLRADTEDLRYLVGAELPLLRRSAV